MHMHRVMLLLLVAVCVASSGCSQRVAQRAGRDAVYQVATQTDPARTHSGSPSVGATVQTSGSEIRDDAGLPHIDQTGPVPLSQEEREQ